MAMKRGPKFDVRRVSCLFALSIKERLNIEIWGILRRDRSGQIK